VSVPSDQDPQNLRAEILPARDGTVSRFIKAEANLLRLPLFALHTKGLRTLDAIECRGKLTRDGAVHDFVFRASRNTATPYPGPLARSAHLAFLSLMTERGFPLQNPVTWSWRDLCRRMQISCSGRTVQRLKAAIRSTKGLVISSQYALFSKDAGRLLRTQERDLSLYDDVAFVSDLLPGGKVADANCLWLSDWYLSNLNALFTAPLDYELWRRLDEHSAIASRLYEFLLLNFYSGVPVLRINYAKLAQFLPVRAEKYTSDARRQLDPALGLLAAEEVIDAARWAESKDGLAQLHFHRGRILAAARDQAPMPCGLAEEEFVGAVEVEEVRNLKTPEWAIVADFYRLWSGREDHRPTKKELGQARELIDRHGQGGARALVQLAVKKLRVRWPEAKTFGGVGRYLDEVAAEYDREQGRLEAERREQARRRREREEQRGQQDDGERAAAAWRGAWDALPTAEREEIRRAVVAGKPYLERAPRLLEGLCLDELARRRGEPGDAGGGVSGPEAQ
jgi:hypothetical protein